MCFGVYLFCNNNRWYGYPQSKQKGCIFSSCSGERIIQGIYETELGLWVIGLHSLWPDNHHVTSPCLVHVKAACRLCSLAAETLNYGWSASSAGSYSSILSSHLIHKADKGHANKVQGKKISGNHPFAPVSQWFGYHTAKGPSKWAKQWGNGTTVRMEPITLLARCHYFQNLPSYLCMSNKSTETFPRKKSKQLKGVTGALALLQLSVSCDPKLHKGTRKDKGWSDQIKMLHLSALSASLVSHFLSEEMQGMSSI